MGKQEIIVQAPEPPPFDAPESANLPMLAQPRSLAQHINAGAVTIEGDRAVAEAQGQLVIAKRFPRDIMAAQEELMRGCQEMSLAEEAFYSYKRGGENISGPSIRLAEELARCWGNIDYGIRELSQQNGVSEMEAYAWDQQTNTRSKQTFTVAHVRDTGSGPKKLTTQRDIYELTANMGGRRLRARILAVMPKWLVALAIDECEKTLKSGTQQTIAERARKMVAAFLRYNVTTSMIEAKIGKKIDAITGEDLTGLVGSYNGIKDGVSSVAAEFGTGTEENKTGTGIAAALKQAAPAKTEAAKPQAETETQEAPKQTTTKAKPQPVAARTTLAPQQQKPEQPAAEENSEETFF